MDLHRAQQEAWANKLAHEFNTTDVLADLRRVRGEVDEAEEAWRQGGKGFGSELADVVIYALGLFEMTGLDGSAEIESKLAVNAARRYERQPDGSLAKVRPDADLEAG